MRPRPYEYIQMDMSGGVAQQSTTSQFAPIRATEVFTATDVFVTRMGLMQVRDGTRDVHASALVTANIQGGVTWYAPTTAVDIVVCNGSLFVASATVSIPTTFTSQGGTMSTSAFVAFAPFRGSGSDKLYIADGGPLNSWDGTTRSENIAGTASVTRLAVYNQRLFGIGDSAAPDTLYWSELNDGDTLGNAGSGGGSAIIRTFGQSKLTGLLPLGNSLLIFHERGISIFTGWSQDDFNISEGTRGLSHTIGTVVPRSIVAIDNLGFFVGNDDVYVVTESGIVEAIGKNIEFNLSQIDPSVATSGFAIPVKHLGLILFFVPQGSSTITVNVYNYKYKSWSTFSGPSWTSSPIAKCGWVNESTNPPTVLLGGSTGFIRKWGGSFGTDGVNVSGTAGTAIAGTVISGPLWKSPFGGLAPRYAIVHATRSAPLTLAWVGYGGVINPGNMLAGTVRSVTAFPLGRFAMGINTADPIFRAGAQLALQVVTSLVGTVIGGIGVQGVIYHRRSATYSPTA